MPARLQMMEGEATITGGEWSHRDKVMQRYLNAVEQDLGVLSGPANPNPDHLSALRMARYLGIPDDMVEDDSPPAPETPDPGPNMVG